MILNLKGQILVHLRSLFEKLIVNDPKRAKNCDFGRFRTILKEFGFLKILIFFEFRPFVTADRLEFSLRRPQFRRYDGYCSWTQKKNTRGTLWWSPFYSISKDSYFKAQGKSVCCPFVSLITLTQHLSDMLSLSKIWYLPEVAWPWSLQCWIAPPWWMFQLPPYWNLWVFEYVRANRTNEDFSRVKKSQAAVMDAWKVSVYPEIRKLLCLSLRWQAQRWPFPSPYSRAC